MKNITLEILSFASDKRLVYKKSTAIAVNSRLAVFKMIGGKYAVIDMYTDRAVFLRRKPSGADLRKMQKYSVKWRKAWGPRHFINWGGR